MSRPANPTWVVPVWAPNASYPVTADPWASSPTKTTHPGAASVGLTPRSAVSAQVLNKLINDAYTTDQAAKDSDTAVLTYLGQTPALNLMPAINATAVNQVKWSPALRKWFGMGSVSQDYVTSTSDLLTWPSATEVSVGARTTQTHWDFDIDTAGNLIAIDNVIDGVKVRTAAGTWSKVTGAIGTDPTEPNIIYEPVNAKWVASFRNGGGTMFVSTSTNLGTTWTARTPPTFASNVNPTLAKNGLGRLVMQGQVGTNVYFSHSDDGGVTWSSAQTIALGFTVDVASIFKPRPVWTGTHWVAVALNKTTPRCKVFQSTTGAAGTWTQVASFATTGIKGLACIGSLILGATTTNALVLSVDGGATWQWSDMQPLAANVTWIVCANDVRFVLCSASGSQITPTIACGPGAGLVT